MRTLRVILTIILFIYAVPTVLSLLDIAGGDEPDLRSEWTIVLFFFILFLLYILLNVLELIKTIKTR